MTQTEVTETINAPIDKVFNCVTDISNKSKWSKYIKSAVVVSQTPNAIGSKYKVVSSPFGKDSEETYELTQYDKDKLVAFDVTVMGKQTRTDLYTFSSNGQLTTITLAVKAQPSGLLQKLLLSSGLKTGNKLLLKELKDYLEATST